MKGPSVTARHVAWQRSALDRPCPSAVGAEQEQRLVESVAGWIRLPRSRGVPMAARTRFFDRQVLEAIDRGTRQIIILGAGYDGRALRFAHPDVTFYEVDQAATSSDKRRRLARLGITDEAIRYIACDLQRDQLIDALNGSGLDCDRPIAVLCEGLLPYLAPSDATRMLLAVRSVAAPSSTLAANFLVRPPSRSVRDRSTRGFSDVLLVVLGERRLHEFTPGDPEALLTRSGWVVDRVERGDADTGGVHGLLVEASPAPGS